MKKVLILNEMIPGKKGHDYSLFRAIEANLSEEDCLFLDSIHGVDLTDAEQGSDDDLLVEKFLNLVYDFSGASPKTKFKEVIGTDTMKSVENLGPYDRVYHVIY